MTSRATEAQKIYEAKEAECLGALFGPLLELFRTDFALFGCFLKWFRALGSVDARHQESQKELSSLEAEADRSLSQSVSRAGGARMCAASSRRGGSGRDDEQGEARGLESLQERRFHMFLLISYDFMRFSSSN